MTASVLTPRQQIHVPPLRPVLWQLIILAQLLIDSPGFLPPAGFRFGLPGPACLALDLGGEAHEPVLSIHRCWVERLYDLKSSWIPIGQIKVRHSTNRVRTHLSALDAGLDGSGAPSIPQPTCTTFRELYSALFVLYANFFWVLETRSAGANNSFIYTKDTRTVKITYCSSVFFCKCLLYVGASHCLG